MAKLEVEIKAHCPDHQTIIDKLISLDAQYIHSLKQDDIYFSHPSRDFNRTDEAFRIRRVNDKIFITYKGPKLGEEAKSRIEEEVEIDNFQSMKRIAQHLGFIEFGTVSKVREVYCLGEIEICIDKVEKLGDFIELEIISSHREEAEKELFKLASTLGLDRFERKSYLELLYE
ncbi:class IV adenylate cyclase [Spirochaetota bacterium]